MASEATFVLRLGAAAPSALRSHQTASWDHRSQPNVTKGPGLSTTAGIFLLLTPQVTLVKEASWISEGTCVLQLMEAGKSSQGLAGWGGQNNGPPKCPHLWIK